MRGAAELAGWRAVDVGTVRALGSPDGRAILRSLPAYDAREVMRLQDRLRREGHSPDFVAALLTQQRLRARAVTKFGEFAHDMLYTADGLEQASRLEVAATHAGRFYNAGLATVHDLGCGIGSDAVAMSALGVTVQGFEVYSVTAAVADINLRPWPDSRARVGLAEEFEPPRDPLRARVGVWLDPARRVPGHTGRHGRIKRVFRLDEIRPTWECPTLPRRRPRPSPRSGRGSTSRTGPSPRRGCSAPSPRPLSAARSTAAWGTSCPRQRSTSLSPVGMPCARSCRSASGPCGLGCGSTASPG